MAKEKINPKKKKICNDCWERFHTQYNEKAKEKKVLDDCPIEVHIRAVAGLDKCQSNSHVK